MDSPPAVEKSTEKIVGVSERHIDDEPYAYTVTIGPKKPWWVDYLPEGDTIPMFGAGEVGNDLPLELKLSDSLSTDTDRNEPPAREATGLQADPPLELRENRYPDVDDGMPPTRAAKTPAGEPVLLIFRDGLDRAIPDLQVEVSGAAASQPRTDDSGALPIQPHGKTGQVKICVKDHDGKMQPVCEIDITRCRNEVKVQSTKVVAKVRSRPIDSGSPDGPGASSSASGAHEVRPWYEVNGALAKSIAWLKPLLHEQTLPVDRAGISNQPHVVAETATRAQQPTTVIVGPEVDEKDNLRLGENNIYRELILKAAKRIQLVPHAICGLLACEATLRCEFVTVKDKKGQVVIEKRGKRKGQPLTRRIPHEWDAHSYNDNTHAGGLTQFLPLTWLDCTLRPGHYISDESIAQNKPWIGMEKGKRVFVTTDGRHHTGRDLGKICKGSDTNVTACLEMRFDAEWSLMAAVDYALQNWRALSKQKGFKNLDALTDGEKIKIMYLLHHEGAGAGPDFMLNDLEVSDRTFHDNVADQQRWLQAADNDRVQAYRLWLADYIDTRIVFGNYAYNVKAVETVPKLFSIFPKIVK